MIPIDNDLLTWYELNHPLFSKVPTFKYYDAPIMGVGPESKPFIRIDNYIDTSNFGEIYEEIERNKDQLVPFTKGLVLNGVVPNEINNGVKSIDSYLTNQEKYLNFDYVSGIKDLQTLSLVKSYFYKHFNITEAWQGVCHMREYSTYANKNQPSKWLNHAQYFPKLTKFIESLPYRVLGYALFFISNGNDEPVFVHRDIFHKAHHKSNFINIMFDKKPRPFFLYDAITKEKVYLDNDCCMYMFNESDLHGVDPETDVRYMLRVEGLFNDDFATEIGLRKHTDYFESFDWSYNKPQQTLSQIKIYEDTDL